MSNVNGIGQLQQKAARLRAMTEAKARQRPSAPRENADQSAPPRPVETRETDAPVGEGEYVVRPGDCLSSIAKDHGYRWESLWDDPSNAALKAARGNPNVLRPGDRVTLPAKHIKKEPGATEMRHRFVLKSEPAKLRLRLLDEDKPRANEPYTLEIDGHVFPGTTDANGRLEQAIPPNARTGKLKVGRNQDEYLLELGHIDPVSSLTGVQARLNNLGFRCGAVDGVLGARAKMAIRAFQRAYQLAESGIPDEATRAKMVQVHGC